MRSELLKVASEYAGESSSQLAGNALAEFIRSDLEDSIEAKLPLESRASLKVKGSPGQGNWAAIPWAAVFNLSVTESATKGYYVVYLYSADMARLYLSLNQGTTAVHDEFGKYYRDELKRRAALARDRLRSEHTTASNKPIDLGATGRLPEGYEAGHILGFTYRTNALPSDHRLSEDLADLLKLYFALQSLGGLGSLDEALDADADSLTEIRRYRLHRSIERNPKVAGRVKALLGYVCQGCSFDFGAVYGDVGRDYIEAHHLIPLASLPKDKAVPMDPQKDFAVLCANCHRMMHRSGSPSTIEELRALPGLQAIRMHHES